MKALINILPRLLTGSLLIALVAWVLFWAPYLVFSAVAIAFVGLGLNEFFALVERKGIVIERRVGLVVGLMIPISILSGFEPTRGWELFFMVVGFLALFLIQMRRQDSSQAIVGISTALFGIFYVSWCFSFIIKLWLMQGPSLPVGGWLVTLLLVATKGGDIGAYFVGSAIGKHPLIPRVSPAKTWEGAIGGLLFSVGGALALKPVFPAVPAYHLLVLGLLLGVWGQLGDLSESIIKRDCQVKDSGNLFPGMGGVLDVLDSLLFTAPICYFYVRKFLLGVPA